MTETDIVHICSQALVLAAKLSGPLLLVALVSGVVISLLQAVFQVQDQTLSMVPRLGACALTIAIAGNWMLRTLVDWTHELYSSIPRLLG